MLDGKEEQTLVVIKPDSFWRNLNRQVEDRIKALDLKVVAECTLSNGDSLPEEKWRGFYFPTLAHPPPRSIGKAKEIAPSPVSGIPLQRIAPGSKGGQDDGQNPPSP